MQYVSRGIYDLTFTLYFDGINGSQGAFDSTATVVLYERGQGRAGTMDTVTLPLISRVRVPYTNPGCQTTSLLTDEVRYARRVYLDPARYTSTRGYYLAWQRSSRNYVITNLGYVQYGTSPPEPLRDIGQTFYLEFPALQTPTGADFINSSPIGYRPLRDYACLGRPFRYPFGGIDPDGDSLIYELVTPLQFLCDSFQIRPPSICVRPTTPAPGPYLPISWAAGYDSVRQIPGSAPLRINRFTGELTFTPNLVGLFVFAVRVREYRRGRLLGEGRREFQELVLNCPLNQNPALSLTAPAPPRTGPLLTSGQLITLPPPGEPGARCLNVYTTDPDTTTRLRLRIVPIDSLPSRPVFTITNGLVNASGRRDSLYSRLCFADCFATNNQPLRFWVIVEDEGCPAPQADTVLLAVRAPGTVGGLTRLTLSPPQLTYNARAGQTVAFALTGTNADGYPITVGATSLNGGPLTTQAGLQSPPVTAPGSATALLTWAVSCTTPPGTYRLRLRASTVGGTCTPGGTADTTVLVTVLPLTDALTTIRLTNAQGADQTTFSAAPGDTVQFTATGTDADNDALTLTGPNLTTGPLAGLGLTFTTTQAPGQSVGQLRWAVPCATPPGTYLLTFRATVPATAADCRPAGQADTAAYVTILPGAATFDPNAPNIITPNGDNRNDRFAPRLSRSGNPADCEPAAFRRLRIFNRWGREVFTTTNEATGWNGADAAEGTYYYLLEYDNRPNVKGWVAVVRGE